MNRRWSPILGGIAALVIAAAGLTTAGATDAADDLISRILQTPPPAGAPAQPRPVPAHPLPHTVPVVMGTRIGEHADKTRFVVEVSDPVTLRAFTLRNPNRVVLDMPAVQWHMDSAPRPSGKGAIRAYRYGQFRSGNSRFVIDLNTPVAVAPVLIIPPSGGYGYRAVVDLVPTTQDKFDASAGWPDDLRAREAAAEQLASLPPAPSPTPAPSQKYVVVIDAGHGGIDSGTSGVNGLMEKDLVLDEALRLGRELARRGSYTVHLTRDTDIFIPLNERTRIARSWRADLFISLHADSNPDPNISGLSIYTLSEKGSDRVADALARKENQSDVIAGVDLGGGNSAVAPILIDLAQRDTMNRSSRFATGAIAELTQATDILPRQAHRSAAFVVLKAPDVPAVLIELGYLSNAADADQMNTARWRNGVAAAVANAVDRYFNPATRTANP